MVKLKISWISNTKRNYHRSENEPLTDSYHEHFYVEKGFKVSDIDPKLAVLESVEILKPPFMVKLITVQGQELGLELLKTLSILSQAQIKLGQSIYHTLDRATDPCRPGSVTHCKEKCRLVERR